MQIMQLMQAADFIDAFPTSLSTPIIIYKFHTFL